MHLTPTPCAVLQYTQASRFYHTPYSVKVPPVQLPITPGTFKDVANAKKLLVAELHSKLYQSLPMLRKSTNENLLAMAVNYRAHHKFPYGGLRSDRLGIQHTSSAEYDT